MDSHGRKTGKTSTSTSPSFVPHSNSIAYTSIRKHRNELQRATDAMEEEVSIRIDQCVLYDNILTLSLSLSLLKVLTFTFFTLLPLCS